MERSFDNVVRMFYNTESNMTQGGNHVAGNPCGLGSVFSNERYGYRKDFLGTRMSVEVAHKILFGDSDTDIAMAWTVPLKRMVEARAFTSDTRLRVQGRRPGSRAFCSRVADDRKLSYPMWERCLEFGMNNVLLHKVVPCRWWNVAPGVVRACV